MYKRHLLFYGRVQGVGFRYGCLALAKTYGVTGRVKNLDDGGVDLRCCHTDANHLQAFIDKVKQGPTPFARVDTSWEQQADFEDWPDFRIQ